MDHRGDKDPELTEPPGPAAADGAASRQPRYASGQYFFEYLVVRDGMAKFQKEEEEKTLRAITLFCFPEGINWAPLTEYHSETFSFVLTEVDGSRRNGYCRRLLPGGKGARPPEAYCIISSVACFGLFSKVLPFLCPSPSAVEEMNRVVSEAFLHFFVRTVGHYGSYVKYGRGGGEGVFEKRSFYKAIDSKTTRHFVKKFIQTQTFDLFMQDVEQRQPGPQQGIFHQKILEYQEKKKKEKSKKH
ncbi:DENN domain-containing protein 2D [Liparis tanakae]|uniref:DENN domain-containing protein 2D n=1 Tax=Liparis tanakae TaxID=230148 RepID=A0A4Z2FP26_9TELE|nr:DENN domain-containing protein 2D [Liparis tanakae]